MAENSLAKIERIPGTDLSIKLRVLANELRKAA
jgi:hypothetical protein